MIACSTSAFKMPLDDALGRVTALGFTHVDLIAIPNWGHIDLEAVAADFDDQAAAIEGLLAKHNLTPVAMNFAVGHLHARDAQTVETRLRHVEALTRLMNRLGVKVASFYPGYRSDRPWDEVLADTVISANEMLAIADAAGVTLAVELHMFTPFETLEQGMRLLEAVPALKDAYDPSHYAMQEMDLHDTAALFPRVAHVHLRDAAVDKMQVPVGQGCVDFGWILAQLDAVGYQGNMSIEYLPNLEGSDAETEIVKLRDLLTR